ncbi:MAG TPA: malonyl-ACP O-methyltransferase BioC [Burkholderiales bacterium]|nr:malonyl-ACP O-methyltransferase BioC [Burkholderiales bacterium]
MNDDLVVDKRRMRQAFERAADDYDAAAVLQHEVCRRMLGRLDYIKHQPALIVDAGCGTGNALSGLRQRYRKAGIVALDIAPAMLHRARARLPRRLLPFGTAAAHAVCGDIEHLPLKTAAAGMVWSSLALQWVNDAEAAFAEIARVLTPGGLLMFSTLGPDTLKELRAAYDAADAHRHVNRFIDMHDLGDMLLAAGFADPVMDMEYVTLTYTDVRALMHDLKAIGARNALYGRPQGLSGKAALAAVARGYEPLRRDGRLPATFEVVYGHAWMSERRGLADDLQPIHLHFDRRAT